MHERVAAHCLAHNISPGDLARRTEMSLQRAQRLLRGKTKIRVDELPTIARALGTTISALYGEDEPEAATT